MPASEPGSTIRMGVHGGDASGSIPLGSHVCGKPGPGRIMISTRFRATRAAEGIMRLSLLLGVALTLFAGTRAGR